MLLLIATAALALPGPDATWTPLSGGPWEIACTEDDGGPWCRAEGTIDAPLDACAAVLSDFGSFPEVFASIRTAALLPDDAFHIVLDMPSPLSDRDYVARFATERQDGLHLYRWTPTTHPDAPVTSGTVRLERSAGEWRLEARDDQTFVRYTWHADLGGSFPSWASGRARRIQADEVLGGLAKKVAE